MTAPKIDSRMAKMEREANQFAMELLMPYDWLMEDLRQIGPIDWESDPNIKTLAKKYNVSEQLMTIRVGQLACERPRR